MFRVRMYPQIERR